MLPQTELKFTVQFFPFVSQNKMNSLNSSIALPYPSKHLYIDLFSAERRFDQSIELKMNKLHRFTNRVKCSQLSSCNYYDDGKAFTFDVHQQSYIQALQGNIGGLFGMRRYLGSNSTIITNRNTKSILFLENLSGSDCLYWITKSINVFYRPYISNKHWECKPKFKLYQSFEFLKEFRCLC